MMTQCLWEQLVSKQVEMIQPLKKKKITIYPPNIVPFESVGELDGCEKYQGRR